VLLKTNLSALELEYVMQRQSLGIKKEDSLLLSEAKEAAAG